MTAEEERATDPGATELDIDIVAEIETTASPEQVWQVIWDLDRYSDWNPECVEAQWTAGATGPAIGACFTGRNELGGQTWTVLCHIIDCTSPTRARWTVQDPAFPSSTWSYTLTPSATGCTVREQFVHGPGNSGIRNMIRANPHDAEAVIAARTRMLTDNIETGLRAIVARAESNASHRDDAK